MSHVHSEFAELRATVGPQAPTRRRRRAVPVEALDPAVRHSRHIARAAARRIPVQHGAVIQSGLGRQGVNQFGYTGRRTFRGSVRCGRDGHRTWCTHGTGSGRRNSTGSGVRKTQGQAPCSHMWGTHQVPSKNQNGACIVGRAAVVGCREHCDELSSSEALEAVHHTFVCAANHLRDVRGQRDDHGPAAVVHIPGARWRRKTP